MITGRTYKRPLWPQSVNSTSDLRCALYEWLVFPLRGDTKCNAYAAFPTLRARAAKENEFTQSALTGL